MKKLFLIVIIVLLSLIVFSIYRKREQRKKVHQFENDIVICAFSDLVNDVGDPQVVVNKPKGMCIWFPKKVDPKSPFEYIILKDEKVPHLSKEPFASSNSHVDYLYSTVVVDISDDELANILKLNIPLFYDKNTKELTVRCNNLDCNRALIYAVLHNVETVWNMSIGKEEKVDNPTDEDIKEKIDKLNNRKTIEGFRKFDDLNIYRKIPVAP